MVSIIIAETIAIHFEQKVVAKHTQSNNNNAFLKFATVVSFDVEVPHKGLKYRVLV